MASQVALGVNGGESPQGLLRLFFTPRTNELRVGRGILAVHSCMMWECIAWGGLPRTRILWLSVLQSAPLRDPLRCGSVLLCNTDTVK